MKTDRSILLEFASDVLNFTSTAFAVKSVEGIIEDANPAFCSLLGYERNEVIGQHYSRFTHPEDLAETDAVFAAFAKGEWSEHHWTKRYLTKDGRTVFCRKKLSRLVGHGGALHLVLQADNITDEVLVAAEKDIGQARLQAAFDAIPGMVALWDQDLVNVFANEAYREFFGKSPEEVKGSRIQDILGTDLFARNEPFLRRALGGETVAFERTIATPTGNRHTIATYIPFVKGGAIHGVFVFVTDNSALKEAQQGLKSILDSAVDLAILSTDLEARIWVFSRGAELVLARAASDILGTADPSRFLDEDELKARVLELAPEVGRSLTPFEALTLRPLQGTSERRTWTAHRPDGSRFPMSLVVSPVLSKEGACTGFLWIGRDVSAEVVARRNLFDAMENAEVANQAKSQFLANMSHEIRTPLNGVLGIAQVLSETELTTIQSDYLAMIQTSGQSLLQILNDILDFSKVEAGRMDIQETPFVPLTLLKTILSLFELRAQEKGLVFRLNNESALPAGLRGDPLRIQQILVNLVGNALKFTEKGKITLESRFVTEGTQGTWSLCVRDTGIGMTPEQTAKLFQPFVQADRTTTSKFGGTGLGLAISKQLAELMGGKLWVESEAGVGSAFWLLLPLATADVDTQAAEPNQKAAGASGLHILLVEDAPINQVVAKALLEKAGATLEICSNGKLAIEALLEQPERFDLVLMDIQMPEMNGLDATRIIRGKLGLKLPIIALSAGALAEEKAHCLEAGMDDFLAKPFQRAEMLATIAKHVGNRMEPPLSFDQLRENLELDQELLDQVLKMFLESLPNRHHDLKAAWEAKQLDDLKRLLHALKGTAGNLTAHELSEACHEVEQALSAGGVSAAEPTYTLLIKGLVRYEAALSRHFGLPPQLS